MSKHKHHIIPVYHCKELGIDPDFDENIVEVDRIDHARIHWGYKCDDLEPLFEYITPAQWIIDLIPRGDNRDVGAAVLTAKGELDEIDMSGENNPMYGKIITPETREKHRQRGLDLVNNNLLYYTDENGDRVRRSFKGKNNARYGAVLTDETKKKISEAHKKFNRDNPDKKRYGKDNPMYGITGENHPSYGRKNSEETKKKMSEQKKQFYIDNPDKKPMMTEEGKKRLSKKRSGQNNPMSRTNIEQRAKKKAETQGEGTLDSFMK
jgi:hypothetical protein